MLSTLGAHWEDVLACVLCTAECVMYVGGELGSIRKRGEETHVVWVHCFVCACQRRAWYVLCAEWVHRFGEHVTCVYITQAEDAASI